MKAKRINWFRVRIFLIACVLFSFFTVIVARMFQLQVLKKEQLYKLASQQQQVEIPLVPKRGTITDRKGNELAVSLEVDSVYIDPRKVRDPERTAKELAAILQAKPAEVREKVRSRSSFEWIQRKISSTEVEQIKALHLPGIFYLKENKRFYPNAHLAAHLIGFVGLDARGLEGVEFQYDAQLNGKGQVWRVNRDALGREIAMDEVLPDREDHYRNVILTIDKQIQHVVESELSRSVQRWGAQGGIAIAMEPSTGRVLAMATYPSFNPNQFLQYRSSVWRNRAISDPFEPGSLFKVFVAAAAMEEKVVRPSDAFYCENGSYTVHDRTLHDTTKHGWLTFTQIMKHSSNIGAAKVGEKMGKDRLYRYIGAFGFGEKTGVGVAGESRGIVHHPRYWPPVALDTISFGQGISVTGIQLVTAFGAIANGGMLMRPSVVEQITDEKGRTVHSFQPKQVRRVISREAAATVMNLLQAATERGGTGEAAVPAGYEVAGKTGTAQKADTRLGGYLENRYISGFLGLAPADDPKMIFLIAIDEPQGANYGGVVAAPVFRDVMEKVLPYLHVHPKGTLIVKHREDASPPGEASQARPGIEAIHVRKEAEKEVMPDLTGLPIRSAMSRIDGKGLIIRVSGNGRVVEQTPKAGMLIQKGDLCYLKLRSAS